MFAALTLIMAFPPIVPAGVPSPFWPFKMLKKASVATSMLDASHVNRGTAADVSAAIVRDDLVEIIAGRRNIRRGYGKDGVRIDGPARREATTGIEPCVFDFKIQGASGQKTSSANGIMGTPRDVTTPVCADIGEQNSARRNTRRIQSQIDIPVDRSPAVTIVPIRNGKGCIAGSTESAANVEDNIGARTDGSAIPIINEGKNRIRREIASRSDRDPCHFRRCV